MIKMQSLRRKIDEIKNDHDSGSTEIAEKAIRLLGEVSAQASDITDLIPVGRELIKSKPVMAAVFNVIEKALERYKMDGGFDAEDIVNFMKLSRKVTISNAVDSIINSTRRPFTLVTCTYSSTFIEFCRKLSKNGRTIVYCLESIWEGHDYGKHTMEELVKYDIDARYIDMKNVEEVLIRADFAMTSADMIIEEEGIINGVPSRFLALRSKKYLPFYVIAESYKKAKEERVKKMRPSDGFEMVEDKYITKLFSDEIF